MGYRHYGDGINNVLYIRNLIRKENQKLQYLKKKQQKLLCYNNRKKKNEKAVKLLKKQKKTKLIKQKKLYKKIPAKRRKARVSDDYTQRIKMKHVFLSTLKEKYLKKFKLLDRTAMCKLGLKLQRRTQKIFQQKKAPYRSFENKGEQYHSFKSIYTLFTRFVEKKIYKDVRLQLNI